MRIPFPFLNGSAGRVWRRRARRAQTLVEYALILAVMSVLAIAIYTLLNNQIILVFSKVANNLDTAQGSH